MLMERVWMLLHTLSFGGLAATGASRAIRCSVTCNLNIGIFVDHDCRLFVCHIFTPPNL